MTGKHNRGFGSMDREKQRSIASKGGRAAHEKGTAHEFNSSEAQKAGRKGGKASQAKRAQLKMTAQQNRATPSGQAAESQVTPSTPPVQQGESEVTQAAPRSEEDKNEPRPLAPSSDIFLQLSADHANILRIVRKMTDSENFFSLQDELYPSLRRELELHVSTEEQVVYPELQQRPEMKETVQDALRDHIEIREIISQLDSIFRSETSEDRRASWNFSLSELRETWDRHVALEETEVFDSMTRVFSAHELEDIAIQFTHAKESLQKKSQGRAA